VGLNKIAGPFRKRPQNAAAWPFRKRPQNAAAWPFRKRPQNAAAWPFRKRPQNAAAWPFRKRRLVLVPLFLKAVPVFFPKAFIRMSKLFNYDEVVCITLEGAKARQAHIQQELIEKHKIPVKFYVAKRSNRSGLIGCFESHIAVIRAAYEKGCKSVMVFEDDAIPTAGYDEAVLADVERFMATNPWEFVQFGYLFLRNGKEFSPFTDLFAYLSATRVPECKNLVHWNGLAAHAYALSRPAMRKVVEAGEKMLALPNDKVIHFDWLLLQVLDPALGFSVVPMQFDQKWCMQTQNSVSTTGRDTDVYEWIARKLRLLCILEKTALSYHLSQLQYYRLPIMLMFVLFVVVCVLIYRIFYQV
jgi:GR25 family glycosyltransferase involved in LPS biosynthesis